MRLWLLRSGEIGSVGVEKRPVICGGRGLAGSEMEALEPVRF